MIKSGYLGIRNEKVWLEGSPSESEDGGEERDDARDRVESLVWQVNEDEGMVRDNRERYQIQGRSHHWSQQGDEVYGEGQGLGGNIQGRSCVRLG